MSTSYILLHLLFVCLYGMSDNIYVKYPHLSVQEHQYFNWKCVVCNGEAQSPLKLEQQHMLYDQSVYEDYNGDKWVKCDECMSPFHLNCATHEPEKLTLGHFVCTFFTCKNSLNFLLSNSLDISSVAFTINFSLLAIILCSLI